MCCPSFLSHLPPKHLKVKTNGKGLCFKPCIYLESFLHQIALHVLHLTSSSHSLNCPAFFYDLKRLQFPEHRPLTFLCLVFLCGYTGDVGLLAGRQDRDRGGREKFLAQELADKVVKTKCVRSLFLEPQKAPSGNTIYLNTRNSIPDVFFYSPECLWTCAKAGCYFGFFNLLYPM